MIMKQKLFILLTLIALSLNGLLTGCANLYKGYRTNQPLLTANEYLQLAAASQQPKKQMYLLQAANRYLQDRQVTQAQQILSQIQTPSLPPTLLAKKQLLQANVLILNHQNSQALQLLQNIGNNNITTTENQIALHRLMGYAYQQINNIPASIKQRSRLFSLVNNDNKKQILLTIWHSVENLSSEALSSLSSPPVSQDVRGWASLALLTKQMGNQPQQLIQALQKWQIQYPRHLANALLPHNLQSQSITPIQPQHIALLLPLQGRYAKQAAAIRNGFFAAYYEAKQKNPKQPTITLYNTNEENIASLYQQAILEGADFIVGPLTKNNVTALMQTSRITVPTLVLNTIVNSSAVADKNLYQFGLSPIDEARQDAIKAWNDHHTHALLITPETSWGQEIMQAFIREWQALGGRIVDQMNYTSQQTLAQQIQKLLLIDQSEARAHILKRILGEKIRFIPRRRDDADVIFLVAQPTIARQIKPLLKYYYGGELPVYATSQIYDGIPNPARDHDLNGIIFCDMPWVLIPNQLKPTYLNSIQQHIKSLWGNSYYRYPKLYALGVDAYDIVPQLNKLTILPKFGINAATGDLYLDRDNHLYRKLLWAQIQQGTPHPIQ